MTNLYGMGWILDRPDHRDYSLESAVQKISKVSGCNIEAVRVPIVKEGEVLALPKGVRIFKKNQPQPRSLIIPINSALSENKGALPDLIELSLPEAVDLRGWFTPVEDQGGINSCTACAAVGLVEYFQFRSFGEYTEASPAFLYKVTRNQMGIKGDLGASLRDTIKAMVVFGVAPEKHWPTTVERFDEEPSPFCYSYAQSYQATSYFNLDPVGMLPEDLLTQIKIVLAAGFPAMFGLSMFESIFDSKTIKKGKIPLPNKTERLIGSHALVAVGYDDDKWIKNSTVPGAFRVRNSWGKEWGKEGYGWLSYDYVLRGLTANWWSLLKNEWVDEASFGLQEIGGVLEGDNGCNCSVKPECCNQKDSSSNPEKKNNREGLKN